VHYFLWDDDFMRRTNNKPTRDKDKADNIKAFTKVDLFIMPLVGWGMQFLGGGA